MKTYVLTFLFLFSCCPPSFAVNVSLAVQERYGALRVNAPVTYGVPFSRSDNVTSTSTLGILGKDAQFRVLSRYDAPPNDISKPIRMVLVDFQDSISANGTNSYTLTDSGIGTVTGDNLATDQTTYIEISTGAITTQISKTSGNIFEKVSISGTPAITSPTDDKFTVVFNGKTYYSSPTTAIIEENGPLRCVLKVDGVFKDATNNRLIPPVTRIGETPDSPVRYTIRYFAYKNKGYIKLQTTLRNENFGWAYNSTQAAHNINITEAYLKTTMNGLANSKTVAFDGYSDSTTSDTYELLQQETSDGSTPSYTWSYSLRKNKSSVATGAKYDSFADLRDGQIGLMVADRWFWQNHPIGITISGNQIKFNLWPDTGSPHRILGSIWKTHELLYNFHGSDTSFDDELAHIKKRLIARASDEYYAQTDFFWGMVPEKLSSDYNFPGGETLQNVLDSISLTHRAMFDESYSTSSYYPNTVLSLREGRKVKLSTNPDIYATGYGWLEFGAMARSPGFGYHNQHYDWSFLAQTGFLRFTDYSLLDIAEELLLHKADIITLHDHDAVLGEPGYEYHGGQRYETDSLFSYKEDYSISGDADPRKVGHHWTNALALQYLLTGEYLYYDAVYSSFEHIDRIKYVATMFTSETRNQFRAIDIMCNGYILTGKTEYLDIAWHLFENALLPAEGGNCSNRYDYRTCTGDGMSGFIIDGVTSSYDFGVGGNAWMAEPFIKLYYVLAGAGETTKAATLKSFMFRWATYIKDTVLPTKPNQGTYRNNNTEYSPYIGYFAYTDGIGYFEANKNSVYLQPYAELFSFMYMEAGSDNQAWLDLARTIQKDSWYYTANVDDFLPVQEEVKGGIQGIVTDASISSGAFKIPKSILKTAFHLRTEWLSNKSDQVIAESKPVIRGIIELNLQP